MSKVTGFETWVVRVPYEEGRRFGTHVVLRLTTDDGLRGVAYVTNLTPVLIKAQRTAIEAFAELVIGEDPVAVESIHTKLMGRAGFRTQFWGMARSAVSVIDIALWDLKAQTLGLPLWRLLGGSQPTALVYASWNLWWQYDIPTLARHAEEHVQRGFKQMKYRMGGVKTMAEAVERTRVLRETVGDNVELMVDMNWSWTVNQTIDWGRAMGPYGLFWIEDPIPADDVEGLREIAAALETPIAAGETYHEASQFRAAIEARALDKVIMDLEVGGITPYIKLSHLVESYGLKVASHTGTEIGTHLVAALSNGLTVEYVPWAQELFLEVPPVKDGSLVLSETPGLGLELDEAALQHFALE
ncbi:MAG TPA: mandelate racemase/muconate lactonizing enzyme family protein [Dehalococcoidia bacterium]|nr:mandelate racemase/muconate lactonizing enzyme family protein [Dehalococcoidia bacterium]